jgi:hypothetical protein
MIPPVGMISILIPIEILKMHTQIVGSWGQGVNQ